jgi:hypothetical protein
VSQVEFQTTQSVRKAAADCDSLLAEHHVPAHSHSAVVTDSKYPRDFDCRPSRGSLKPPRSINFIERNLMKQLLLNSLLAVLPVNALLAQTSDMQTAAPQTASPITVIIALVIAVLMIAAMWKVFAKAGQPGWACLIPIYNLYVMCKVAGRPGWWLLLMLIPFVNFIIVIILCIDIAKSFGNGVGFGLGLAFLGIIFWPILGFGSAQYQGPSAGGGAAA